MTDRNIFTTINISKDFDGFFSQTHTLTLKYIRTVFARNGSIDD
jgi:hypothetical protein